MTGSEDVSRGVRVLMTVNNVIFTAEDLSKPTPSMIDGLTKNEEIHIRFLGCELIQTAGQLLKLPQVAMANGQVLFQRFFYKKSLVRHNFEVVAMACIFLAAKIEEDSRQAKDVINVFYHIKQMGNSWQLWPLALDAKFEVMKNNLLCAERRLLKELGFCVHVKHAHKLVISYLRILDQAVNSKLTQYAWNLVNDCLRTDIFVRFHPEAIACGCIFLAARQLQVPLPESPPWYELLDVDYSSIKAISKMLLFVYSMPKPNYRALRNRCEELRKMLETQQQAAIYTGPSEVISTPDSDKSHHSSNSQNNSTTHKPMEEEIKRENGHEHENDRLSRSSHPDGRSKSRKRKRSYSRSLTPSFSSKKKSRSRSRHHKRSRYDDGCERKRSRKHRRRSRSHSPSASSRYVSKSSKKKQRHRRRSVSLGERSPSHKHNKGERDSRYHHVSKSHKKKRKHRKRSVSAKEYWRTDVKQSVSAEKHWRTNETQSVSAKEYRRTDVRS